MQIQQYLDALASAEPTPGGGSAAALVGATGAALVAMTARVALRSKRLLAVHPEAERIAAAADELRDSFIVAGRADETAYAAVVAAYGLAKESDSERELRTAALAEALEHAAEAPLNIARVGAQVAQLAEQTLALGNQALFSDVLCGAEFATASIYAAAANVRINHRSMRDAATVQRQAAQLEQYIRAAEDSRDVIRSVEE